MAFDIIVVGSTTQDVFVDTKNALFHNTGRQDCVRVDFGSKILVENIRFAVGGGAHNTAVNFQRMGFKTAVVSVVGNDTVGATIQKTLAHEGIDTSFLVKKQGHSSYSLILDSLGRERTILAYKGVNDDLSLSDIALKKLDAAQCVYFSTMLGHSFNTQQKLILRMHARGILTVFNPSYYLAAQGLSKLKKFLRSTNVLIFNREEASALSGASSATPIEKILRTLSQYGPQHIIITDGRHPLFGYDSTFFYRLQPTPCHVVETTGAGDAFASSFTAAFLRGFPFDVCLCVGLAQSQSVITHSGATNRLLDWKTLMTLACSFRKRVGVYER